MLSLRKGHFSEKELLNKYHAHPSIIALKNGIDNIKKDKFKKGDTVMIRGVCSDEIKYESWRLFLGLNTQTHVRQVGYLVHKIGVIQSFQGLFKNEELTSLGINDTKVAIFKVRFKQKDIFKDESLNEKDTIDIDILVCNPYWSLTLYSLNEKKSHWLQRVDPSKLEHNHTHDHDAQPVHKDRSVVEQNAIDKEPVISPYQVISEIVIDILCEKGMLLQIVYCYLHKHLFRFDHNGGIAKVYGESRRCGEAWTGSQDCDQILAGFEIQRGFDERIEGGKCKFILGKNI